VQLRSLVLLLVVRVALTGDLSGQAGPATLESLSFMSGCWQGVSDGNSTIEETYTRPSSNVMLGTTRYLREGRTTMFEFTLISRDSAGVSMLPYPRGRPSEHAFKLTSVEGGRAVFEAPEHDFPKRIIYRRVGPDELTARIDGGEQSSQSAEWRLTRASCPPQP